MCVWRRGTEVGDGYPYSNEEERILLTRVTFPRTTISLVHTIGSTVSIIDGGVDGEIEFRARPVPPVQEAGRRAASVAG